LGEASWGEEMESTLLLNASYEPLMVIDWRRAVTLLFLGKTDVLEEYQRELRSPGTNMRVPSVMRLRERVRFNPREQRVPFSRQNVFRRDGERCQYCGAQRSARELTLDHVLPKSRGGASSFTNVVSCCRACNHRKANRTPEEAGMVLLSKPRAPKQSWTLSPSGEAQWRAYLFWNQ
jgi:5-methylcytosine-specific restriction endonuclease McrA